MSLAVRATSMRRWRACAGCGACTACAAAASWRMTWCAGGGTLGLEATLPVVHAAGTSSVLGPRCNSLLLPQLPVLFSPPVALQGLGKTLQCAAFLAGLIESRLIRRAIGEHGGTGVRQ